MQTDGRTDMARPTRRFSPLRYERALKTELTVQHGGAVEKTVNETSALSRHYCMVHRARNRNETPKPLRTLTFWRRNYFFF